MNKVPINWESSGYSVLKNLNATILGVFCEFIDNSIQSYKNQKSEISKYHENYKLKIEISYDGDEIIIKDNAGGINAKDFQRALKPANRPDNLNGLNEFGLGMKYAAVWLSNEWELTSSAIGEDIERNVLFNYSEVVTNNLMELPTKEVQKKESEHYTEVTLRKLEKKHVHPFQWDYLKKKLASIYRNFIRSEDTFFSTWKEDSIDLIVFGEKLDWKEYGFLKVEWWKDRQALVPIPSPVREWKYKFDWMDLPIEEEVLENNKIVNKKKTVQISGFVGILPDGDQKNKNGFTLFRRGRMVEGWDNREYPRDISGAATRSRRYIKLYGEIHFKNIDISFDKTKLSINRSKRDECFSIIALMLKKVTFRDGKTYNLIQQADNYKSTYQQITAKKAIENVLENHANKSKDFNNELAENKAANEKFDKSYEEEIQGEFQKSLKDTLPVPIETTTKISEETYSVSLNFVESEKFYITQIDKNSKKITITLGMKNQVVRRCYDGKKTSDKFDFLCGIIQCLAISETKAELGMGRPRDFRYAINAYISSINLLND